MKHVSRNVLALEPLEPHGVRVGAAFGNAYYTRVVALSGDFVGTIARLVKSPASLDTIIVRVKTGSFSATRMSWVAASIISAVTGASLFTTFKSLDSLEDVRESLLAAHSCRVKYRGKPHITKPNKLSS